MWILPMERMGVVSVQARPLAAVRVVNDALKAGAGGVAVGWLTRPAHIATDAFPEGHDYLPGAFVLAGPGADDVIAAARAAGCEAHGTTDVRVPQRRLGRVRVGLYMGRGAAEFCYAPLRKVLDDGGFCYTDLTDGDLRASVPDCDVLLVPGGPDAGESFYAGLGERGYGHIRAFVSRGGAFFGICAGAYLALRPHSDDTQRYWLGLADATDVEGLDYWRTGAGFVRIRFVENEHPVAYSLAAGSPSTLDIIYWEGPAFSLLGPGVRALATFDDFVASGTEGGRPFWDLSGNPNAQACIKWANPLTRARFDRHLRSRPALLETTYGSGRVLLYSPHAEFGSTGSSSLDQSQSFMLVTNGLFHLGVAREAASSIEG